jgi:topoisomerase-4 subunit B
VKRKERKLAGIKKLANERAKKANLHNKKLRDCRLHLNDEAPAKGKEEFFAKQNQTTILLRRVIVPAVQLQRQGM